MRKFWTTTELAVIRAHYPAGGINACEPHLPGRTRSSIWQQAGKLGLRSPRQKVDVRQSWPRDPHIDEQLRFAHQQAPKKGDIERLAKRVGRPVWWVSKRARELGLTTPRFREAPWSDAELKIADDTRELTPEGTQRALKRAGFTRTITAVIVKRKRLSIPVPERVGVYTTGQVANLLGYERSTVIRWIRLGLLRTQHRNADAELREITDRDLREFFKRHPLQADLRRLPLGNRPWFVQLLTGDAGVSVNEAISA